MLRVQVAAKQQDRDDLRGQPARCIEATLGQREAQGGLLVTEETQSQLLHVFLRLYSDQRSLLANLVRKFLCPTALAFPRE